MPPHQPTAHPRVADDNQSAAKVTSRGRGISPLWACLATAMWIIAFDNGSFWQTFAAAQGAVTFPVAIATLGLAFVLTVWFAAVLRPFAHRRPGLIVMCSLLILSAGVSHYIDTWGVLFDKGLIRNIVETDVREMRELLSWPALFDLAWRGLVPAAVLCVLGLSSSPWKQTLGQTITLGATATLLTAAIVLTSYGILASTFRNHRELRFQLVPTNYVNAVYGHLKGSRPETRSLARIAPDANRPAATADKPLVLVLIVGETARAANFSLGGYGRNTNAALAGAKLVYFNSVESCGTDTATSLPCMFSDLGAERFSVAKAQARENVLDVLQRAGVKVEWLDNNSGCKGVCARVSTQQMPTSGVGDLCSDGACLDEVLVTALGDKLSGIRQDTALILHQMGSHGPAYYRRYPAPGRFQPTCQTNRIQTCNSDALVNTYDNSIDYTSQTIARAIEVSKSQDARVDVAVVYISDHGESLGERNIYLHGLPTLLAPSEQVRVPMLVWLSDGAQRRLKLPLACLNAVATRPYSHDNLFPSMLGFFSVSTAAYKAEFDIWAIARSQNTCRANERLTLQPLQGFQSSHTSNNDRSTPDQEST